MSNQRAGKWKPAGLDDGSREGALLTFFKEAQAALEAKGEEDAAFYFEQCVEWMTSGKSLYAERVSRVLGL
jgi:hypothetical protein